MRLIIKEYISKLKEKDELDNLISAIYNEKGYSADNVPKTGNRQYGVDIQMHNDTELIWFVVKQGNINRNIWDGDKNAVRQSLNEIKDVKINNLSAEHQNKSIKIIVATNGYIDESINLNWSNYVNNNKSWNGYPIEISFMGIDDIVENIIQCFFNEYLFEEYLRSNLRKALYFIDEGDYKNIFYEAIIDALVSKIENSYKSRNSFEKHCATLYMASQMICSYADNVGANKIAISVSEYAIIKYWQFLFKNNLFEKEVYTKWIISFLKSYEKWNDKFVLKIKKFISEEIILPHYNVVETRVQIYEIIGFLSSYGNCLLDYNTEKARNILNIIIEFINKYDQFVYAPYDASIGIVIMLLRLLKAFDRFKDIQNIIEAQTYVTRTIYILDQKYPTASDSFEDALAIEFEKDKPPYETTAFWGYYVLLICALDQSKIYDELKDFLNTDLENTTKCVWFLRKTEEEFFYSPYAMNRAGEGIEVHIEENFEKMNKAVSVIFEEYKNENFSFDEFSFKGLEYILCRYYKYIPRVHIDFN